MVLVHQQPGLFLQFLVGLLQLLLAALQLLGQRLRLGQQAFGPHVGLDRVDHDSDRFGQLVQEGLVGRVEALHRRQLDHAPDFPFEDDWQHQHIQRRHLGQPGRNPQAVRDRRDQQDFFLVVRALSDQALAEVDLLAVRALAVRCVTGHQVQPGRFLGVAQHVELSLLRADHRRQLGQDQVTDGDQVFLALQHARELGQVGLEPVLLGVDLGRVLEVADHLVDGVFQRGHLAQRLHRDRPRQVALRHCRRHLGNRAHLGRQVGGQLVHVLRQALPGA